MAAPTSAEKKTSFSKKIRHFFLNCPPRFLLTPVWIPSFLVFLFLIVVEKGSQPQRFDIDKS